jgi:hypothetical protein
MGYQLNERYLAWDSSAQRQLILIWVAQQVIAPQQMISTCLSGSWWAVAVTCARSRRAQWRCFLVCCNVRPHAARATSV